MSIRPTALPEAAAADLPPSREVLFEVTVQGGFAKVAAIDSATAVEVCVVGPAHAAKGELQRLAVAKLRARLARQDGTPI
jgi:hypothetical protein